MEIIPWLIIIGLLPEPQSGTPADAGKIAIWLLGMAFFGIGVYHLTHRYINKKNLEVPVLITVLSALLVIVFIPGLQLGIVATPILVILAGGWLGYKNSGQ